MLVTMSDDHSGTLAPRRLTAGWGTGRGPKPEIAGRPVWLISPELGSGQLLLRCHPRRERQLEVLPGRYTVRARIAGCPCRTVLRGAVVGVGPVSKRDQRRRRGDLRLLTLIHGYGGNGSPMFVSFGSRPLCITPEKEGQGAT